MAVSNKRAFKDVADGEPREVFEYFIKESIVSYERAEFLERIGNDYVHPIIQCAWEIFQDWSMLYKIMETARKLDHLGMDKMYADNKKMKDCLLRARQIMLDFEFLRPGKISEDEKRNIASFMQLSQELIK